MNDILLAQNGDIKVSNLGDISLTDSIRQAVLIRLRWIREEWRLGPDLGFPYYEEVFVKNPNLESIKQLIRSEILEVEGVTDAEIKSIVFDSTTRKLRVRFVVVFDRDTYEKEVELDV